MDMWMKVVMAAGIVLMMVLWWPRMKQMMQNSPEAKPGDWQGFILPILAVVVFVLFLMWIV